MLRVRLSEDLKNAMRAKEQRAVSTIRMILAELKLRDIAAREKGNTEGIGEPENRRHDAETGAPTPRQHRGV